MSLSHRRWPTYLTDSEHGPMSTSQRFGIDPSGNRRGLGGWVMESGGLTGGGLAHVGDLPDGLIPRTI